MHLSSLSQDILQEISKHVTLNGIYNLIQVCKTLHAAILEDRYLWYSILNRDIGRKLPRLPTNAVPTQDASVVVLRAWVKHAYVLERAYRRPSLDRAVVRIDTPARVTFVKLVRGRWFLVASSDTTISELSVWEILSPSDCALRKRVYFPAPVLDGNLDDGGSYIRLAVTVGTCRPSIRILEFAKDNNDEIILVQHAEIADASHVLYLKGPTLFFASLHGDDTWPVMTNWMNGGMARLSYLGRGGMGDTFPLTLDHCAGLHVWGPYILFFAYSGLHIYTFPDLNSMGMTRATPIKSLALPEPIFKVTFLDEHGSHSDGDCVTNLRWVAHLDCNKVVIIELTCSEEENSVPLFEVNTILNTRVSRSAWNRYYAIDYAIGSSCGHIIWIAVNWKDYIEAPKYTIAPIRSREDESRIVDWDSHISIEEPRVIPSDCLPFTCLFPCFDFDDGHGILLIGSDAGQFCLVNFADALLPDEAVHGDLPSQSCADIESVSEIPLELDIPAYYSYRYRSEYESEERPAVAVEDAIRLWGDSFANHPPVPGWSNNWSEFLYIKDWILPLSLWSMHDSDISEDWAGHRIRARLYSVGEITPILYDIDDHARVIFRMGNRVLYCRNFLYDDYDSSIDETGQPDALGALTITYDAFIAADSDTILALIDDSDARINLEARCVHTSTSRKEYAAKSIAFALKEASSIGRAPDKKTLEDWKEEDWETMDKKYAKIYEGTELNDSNYMRFVSR